MQRYLFLLLPIAFLQLVCPLSVCSLFAQEMREGASAFVLSEEPVFAWMEDDTKVAVPFGHRITIEEIVPNNIAARYQGQVALFESHAVYRLDEARTYLDDLVQHDPTSHHYCVKGQVETILRNMEQAILDLDSAIKLDPKNSRAWLFRGSAKAILKEYDEAELDVNKALDLNPESALANSLKFYVFQMTERREEAIEYIQKAVELDPNRAMYHSNLGSVLLQLGKREEAIASFNKAVEVEPAYYTGHYFMGLATSPDEELRDGEKAIELASELVESSRAEQAKSSSLQRVFYQYQQTLAAAYAEGGEFEKAIETLNEIDTNIYSDGDLTEMLEQFQNDEPYRDHNDE